MIKNFDIHISEAEVGMIIADDIYNNYGAILLHKDSILDLYTIEKLESLGIKHLKVFEEYTPVKTNKTPAIETVYKENVTKFKDMFKDIGNGKSLDTIRVQNIVSDLRSTYTSINDILQSLNSVRNIDDYTYSHSLNVSLLSSLISQWLGLDDTQCRLISYCGLLHDIGKSKIDPEILNKPGPLTESEFEEIKKHPLLGYRMLEKNIAINKNIALGVLLHHEREDGSGYPFALTSAKIHLYAKIVAIADIFDAMTSNRVYKSRQTPFDVFSIYESEYLTKCDTKILLTFLRKAASFYIGNLVKLNNDMIGEVIFINEKYLSRPMIKLTSSKIVDLSKEPKLKIKELI